MTLDENLAVLQAEVSQLKADRNSGALQNDVYEAIDDLCHLSRAAVSGDTRVNYAARAKGDNNSPRDSVQVGNQARVLK